jgi:oligoribonuclease NrnB/cAMP/cGMP phosphodiesterase (DHH superfamily)
MVVKNTRIQGGTFCADKNIIIIYPDGSRDKLISVQNIPVCPDSYKFKAPGEQLDFVLLFPPLKPGTEWIDLVEECNDYCFSFYGVTLDNALNKLLDSAFNRASYQKPSENITLFASLIDSLDNRNLGIEGLLYINIIDAAMAEADKVNTIVWYKRLASSNAPRLNQYLKYLNDKGIKY